MELAFLLRGVGAEVCWITNQKPSERDEVVHSLEHKMLGRGVQVIHNVPLASLTNYLRFWCLYHHSLTKKNLQEVSLLGIVIVLCFMLKSYWQTLG